MTNKGRINVHVSMHDNMCDEDRGGADLVESLAVFPLWHLPH